MILSTVQTEYRLHALTCVFKKFVTYSLRSCGVILFTKSTWFCDAGSVDPLVAGAGAGAAVGVGGGLHLQQE
jgi:hypothetical protein